MSCSKWAYEPEKCDGQMCVGDCDFCDKAEESEKDRPIDEQQTQR